MQPETAQRNQLIRLERVTEPVAEQDIEKQWRMLRLGTPATPPVGEQESETENTMAAPSQHRDGRLMRIETRCCGHQFMCLIDSGASRCYIDSQVVLRLGLQPVAENATLELGDGTRVPSKGCIENLIFTMGSRTFSQNFTVTDLMTGVDMVLGMTWLEQVNPLINWGSHTMYVRDQEVYYPIAGVPADEDTKIGTVKHVKVPNDEKNDQSVQYLNSLEKMASPQFWEYIRDDQQWRSVQGHEIPASTAGNKEQQASTDDQQRSSKFCKRTTKTPRGVQQKTVRSTASQREFISLKQMRKLTARGETSYLLMIRSFGKEKTQKRPKFANIGSSQGKKRSEMLKTGPVKQFKTAVEVMKEVVEQASPEVQGPLRNIIQDYQDVFPEKLPKGVPPSREVEHAIETDPEAVPPSRAPYRLGPKEMDEMEEQIKDLLSQGYIRPSYSPYGAPILFVPKKDGRWRMCIDYRPAQSPDQERQIPGTSSRRADRQTG